MRLPNISTLTTPQNNHLAQQVDDYMLNQIARQRHGIHLTQFTREIILKIVRDTLFDLPVLDLITQLNQKIRLKNFICFVSIVQNNKTLACIHRPGNQLADSIYSAARNLKNILSHNINKSFHIEINILFNKKTYSYGDNKFINKFRIGIDSIGMIHKKRIALFKNSVPIKYGYSCQQLIELLAKKCNAPLNTLSSDKTSLLIYDTIEFREDYQPASHFNLYDLYRGNGLILQSETTETHLKKCARITAVRLQYFLSALPHPIYEYDYLHDHAIKPESSEAVLRVITSMTALANYHPKSIVTLEKIADYFINKYFDKITGCLSVNELSDLGINGCFLETLNTLHNSKYKDTSEKLVAFIFFMFDDLNHKFKIVTNSKPISQFHESEFYFPGMALCGLLSCQNRKVQEKAIQLAKHSFPYYHALFNKHKDGIKMLHWMTKAYGKAYHLTCDPIYSRFIFELNDKVAEMQIQLTEEIDLTGSFSKTGNVRATAAILESLIEAAKVASLSKDFFRLKIYEKCIQLGLRFILQTQHREDNTFNASTLGGFDNNFFDKKIRIDNLQHVLNVLNGVLTPNIPKS
ncbi:MAG: hypothetical protein SFW66_08195 [Gammaproteobacteria bacterium]|nr:hypothetical protein [Gammaproteobacteria bacterium]